MLNKKALSAARIASSAVTDPDFEYVTMLLHGDGTNGAQNNTFTDGSTNNFTTTRNGNTTQGTFSPYSPGWSNFFDGNGDYLSTPNVAALRLGSGDFTVEAWIYPTRLTNTFYSNICGTYGFVGNVDRGWLFYLDASGNLALFMAGSSGSSFTLASTTKPTINAWSHFAAVRSGTTVTLYYNGTSVATGTSSKDEDYSVVDFNIGTSRADTLTPATGNSGTCFQGYISNLRVVKGTAVYTANFTPPTSALTAVTNTQLLTCQSNRFRDNSSNGFTITRNGDVRVQPFNPFSPAAAYSTGTNGGSGYFDGTGDYLSVADNANLRLGTSAFTIQAWIYRNSAGATHSIIAKGGASTGFVFQVTSTNVLRFTHGSTNIDTITTIPATTWTHVAAVRTGTGTNGFQLYINGVSSATATVSTNFNQTDTLYVGADRGAANVMNGYICDVKYTNGTAETISVPTSPATATTNVALLLNFTNGAIIDNAMDNVLETVGNAQISTSVKKFGTGSLSFDGTGDYLSVPSSPLFYLSSGNFTVEAWVYKLTSGRQIIVGQTQNNSTPYNGWLLFVSASNFIRFEGTNGSHIQGSTTFPLNQWVHVAAVKSGTTTTLYVDGTSVASGTVSITDFNGALRIGQYTDPVSGSEWNGYIDDLRITRGVARYTANFTPPTAAFPDL